ncbi:ROK family protein, partial [Rhodococcus sp. O3]|uniref:ROK family protein n=1 Tax=Rhodococcus sp. O3 TaxID=3404919 RepID=UPI003B66D90E
MTALAFDVGGTKLAASTVGDNGIPLAPLSVPTPTTGVWDAAATLLRHAAGDQEITAVGIASAGPIDTTAGTVAPVNIAEWAAGFALVDGVQALFPSARIRLVVDGA